MGRAASRHNSAHTAGRAGCLAGPAWDLACISALVTPTGGL